MPTVEMKLPARNAPSLKRTSRHVFPTPESPTSITCTKKQEGRAQPGTTGWLTQSNGGCTKMYRFSERGTSRIYFACDSRQLKIDILNHSAKLVFCILVLGQERCCTRKREIQAALLLNTLSSLSLFLIWSSDEVKGFMWLLLSG